MTSESPLKRDFEYYVANQNEFVQKYNGKVIVLKNRELFGVFDDEVTAVAETKKNHEIGTFLVQRVTPGAGSYTQTFHSRVAFAN